MFYVESILSHKKFETENSDLIKTGRVFLLDTTYTSNSKLTYLNNNPDSEIFRVICEKCYSEFSFKKSDNKKPITHCPFCENRKDRGFYLLGSAENLHGFSLVEVAREINLICSSDFFCNPNRENLAIIPASVAVALEQEKKVTVLCKNFSIEEVSLRAETHRETWEFVSEVNKTLCKRLSVLNIHRHNYSEQFKNEDIYKLIELIQGLPDHSFEVGEDNNSTNYYQCDFFDPDGVGELGTATQIGHKWLIANETKGNHFLCSSIDDFKSLNIYLNDGYYQLYKFSDGNIFYANSDFSIVKYFCGSKYQSKEFKQFLNKVNEVCI